LQSQVHADLVVRADARTGWAIRKHSPKLQVEIDDFYRSWAMKQGVAGYRMSRHMKRVKELKNPTAGAGYQRLLEAQAGAEKARRQIAPAKN
jgi:hypothetical protein